MEEIDSPRPRISTVQPTQISPLGKCRHMKRSTQPGLFGEAPAEAASLPEGFKYQADLISSTDEQFLLAEVRKLPFKEFEFHGFTGKRRVVSFGWKYDFNQR